MLFTEVSLPKSIVYANFTTDAYSILGCALRFERRFCFSPRYRYLNPARLPISPHPHSLFNFPQTRRGTACGSRNSLLAAARRISTASPLRPRSLRHRRRSASSLPISPHPHSLFNFPQTRRGTACGSRNSLLATARRISTAAPLRPRSLRHRRRSASSLPISPHPHL